MASRTYHSVRCDCDCRTTDPIGAHLHCRNETPLATDPANARDDAVRRGWHRQGARDLCSTCRHGHPTPATTTRSARP